MDLAFHADETVSEGVQRMAAAELAAALDDVEHPRRRGVPESVHDLRKRCKQLRALARLVRDEVGDGYRPANAAFRDAARELSRVRDTQVLVEVLEGILARADDDAGEATLDAGPLREALVAEHRRVTDGLARDPAPFGRARAQLEQGAEVVRGWQVGDGFDAVAGGLGRTYGRTRAGRRRCRDEGASTEDLHEWRKQVKHHWYHLRLLGPSFPQLAVPWADAVHELSDVLGDDHDLAVLVDTLRAEPLAHGGEHLVADVCARAERRRGRLQAEARRLGHRLTAEHPDAVVDRLRLWWDAWRS